MSVRIVTFITVTRVYYSAWDSVSHYILLRISLHLFHSFIHVLRWIVTSTEEK